MADRQRTLQARQGTDLVVVDLMGSFRLQDGPRAGRRWRTGLRRMLLVPGAIAFSSDVDNDCCRTEVVAADRGTDDGAGGVERTDLLSDADLRWLM
ncbi:hypothetical protein ACLOJK_003850 [Asimina triloba]